MPTDDIKILHRLAMMYDEYGMAVECDSEKMREYAEIAKELNFKENLNLTVQQAMDEQNELRSLI